MYKVPLHWMNVSSSPMFVGSSWCLFDFSSATGCCVNSSFSAQELNLFFLFCLFESDAGRDWGQEEKGMTEDEMAGWHH